MKNFGLGAAGACCMMALWEREESERAGRGRSPQAQAGAKVAIFDPATQQATRTVISVRGGGTSSNTVRGRAGTRLARTRFECSLGSPRLPPRQDEVLQLLTLFLLSSRGNLFRSLRRGSSPQALVPSRQVILGASPLSLQPSLQPRQSVSLDRAQACVREDRRRGS